jgi:hypothetical protein
MYLATIGRLFRGHDGEGSRGGGRAGKTQRRALASIALRDSSAIPSWRLRSTGTHALANTLPDATIIRLCVSYDSAGAG